PFILYLLFRFSKFTRKNSFLAGITAAQVSEFGFIVLFMGRQFGHVDDQTLSIFTLVALITIFSSSYLITYNERIYDKFLHPLFSRLKKDKHRQQDRASESYDAIIIGYHRIGWKICEALKEKNIKFAVIDYNPEAIGKLSSRRIPAFFGDISDLEFLESMPLEKAKLIISTIPDPDDQKCLITYVRTVNKGAVIIANLSQNLLLKDLYRAGADYVMMPHLLGGHWMSEIIKSKHWNKETFAELQKEQEAEMQLRCACSSH
ncbi:MAG TPA: hypothetical protein DIT25_03465, partial [Candidatus Moranbacteria bacterium]|nr:hypothetical protein [Candidatus Moranbacteria bacterium]